MVKFALILFWCGLVFVGVNGVPVNSNSDKINLSSLPAEAFISPKASTGERVKAWRKSKNSPNPDELGEYFQGDILFPGGIQRNGLISTSSRWPTLAIPYVITGKFSSTALANINAAINNYKANSCVTFVKRRRQTDYISITSDNTGCWSSVGKVGGRQKLNLQDPGCTIKGVIEHELLHATGFFHEQSRPDRDTYVTVNFTNVQLGMEHNFNKYADTLVTTYNVTYDYGSVMHYSADAFSSNKQPTITTIPPGIPIGQRDGLSAKDFEKLNAMYKCVKTSTGWTG